MKTRKFKHKSLQDMYDLFRNGNHSTYYNTAAGSAYRLGLDGHCDPGVPTSLAHAAWAAGADERADKKERELYDEMDGSAVFNAKVEDLY